MKLLTDNEEQTLCMCLPHLSGGFKSQAIELLNNSDPTGGIVAVDDQVKVIYEQYVSTWHDIDDVYEPWQDTYEIRDNMS